MDDMHELREMITIAADELQEAAQEKPKDDRRPDHAK